jgi:hypothetical protein
MIMETCGDAYQPDAIHRYVCDQPPGHRDLHDGPCTRWELGKGKPGRVRWANADHRDPGALLTVGRGDTITIWWSGEPRTVICDRITRNGAVLRDLTRAEQDRLGAAEREVAE